MTGLRTLIIGCGRIAGSFDAGSGIPDQPLTHAGAYTRDGRFEIVACVEPDEARRKAFMRRWGIGRGYASAEEALRDAQTFEVVSVCSPTERHAEHLKAALAFAPRLVFCEKPVTPSVRDTEHAVNECQRAGVALAVNYTRRWDPEIARLREGMAERRWGVLRCAVGYYNKGLLNNGSHLLDLLLLLLGPLKVVHVGRPVQDGLPEDPTVPVWLESASTVPIHIACGHAADFALFELQLVFSKAVLTMEEGGMAWRERKIEESGSFAGYRVPSEGVRRAGGYPQAMLRSVGNIYAALREGRPLASTGASALDAQRLCERILQ